MSVLFPLLWASSDSAVKRCAEAGIIASSVRQLGMVESRHFNGDMVWTEKGNMLWCRDLGLYCLGLIGAHLPRFVRMSFGSWSLPVFVVAVGK